MIRLIAAVLAIFIVHTAIAQSGDAVLLKWKLQPKEVIAYKTLMEDMDTASAKDFKVNFGNLNRAMGDSTHDNQAEMIKIVSEMRKAATKNNYVTTLTRNDKGFFDVEMRLKPEPETKRATSDTGRNPVKEMMKMMGSMSNNVMLRGAINDNGTVQSFYVKNDQKNLVALLFELPDKPLKVGDKWSLDTHLISMDQNFKCDSSYRRNIVTLVDLRKVGSERIAVIKYNIFEFVLGDFKSPFSSSDIKTSMGVGFTGIAEFSIDKGRWSLYDGVMTLKSTGIMTSDNTQRIKLFVE